MNNSKKKNTCYLVALISNKKYVRPEIKQFPLFSLSSKKKRKERKKTRYFFFYGKRLVLSWWVTPHMSLLCLADLTLHCTLRLLCLLLIAGPFYIISHEPLKHDHWWEAPSTKILGGNREICGTVLNKITVHVLLTSGFLKVS